MPSDILDIVQAGLEVAKSVPNIPDRVRATEMPAATTPEEIEANKQRYHNTDYDIADALEPGERFLTNEEAAERRAEIMRKRKEQGLDIYN